MPYRFADLVVESEVPLSELPVAHTGTVDCLIRMGSRSRRDPDREHWDHHWRSPSGEVSLSCARDGDAYRLGMPGVATFRIDGEGRAITCHPDVPLAPSTLEHLLIDQVLPRVLNHLGRLTIHAGCVATENGAVGFLGDSGAGKSTMCGAFARAGHPLLGDDGILVRRVSPAGFEAVATYPGLRLHPAPLSHLFDDANAGAPMAHYSEKRRVAGHLGGFRLEANPHPLRVLYVLETGPAIEIAPLPAHLAFMALVKASFQLHLDDEARSRSHFERIAELLDGVPVRRLSYPRSFARLGDVREAVLADVRALAIPASSEECACS